MHYVCFAPCPAPPALCVLGVCEQYWDSDNERPYWHSDVLGESVWELPLGATARPDPLADEVVVVGGPEAGSHSDPPGDPPAAEPGAAEP